ncbi:MAG: hypothetical protein R3F33_18080 [Planctomycetota bacterium]
MHSHSSTEAWVDRLVVEPEAKARLRLSLEACLGMARCPGVSLHTERSPSRFVCERELGRIDFPIDSATLLAVADGQWDPRQARQHVLVVGTAPQRMAWVLSLPVAEEEELDALEALLFLVHTLHPDGEAWEGPDMLPSAA